MSPCGPGWSSGLAPGLPGRLLCRPVRRDFENFAAFVHPALVDMTSFAQMLIVQSAPAVVDLRLIVARHAEVSAFTDTQQMRRDCKTGLLK